jgi:hypothetical protein
MYTLINNDDILEEIVKVAASYRSEKDKMNSAQTRIMNIIGSVIGPNKNIDVDPIDNDIVIMSVYSGMFILSFKCTIINGNVNVSIVEIINDITNNKSKTTFMLSDENSIIDYIHNSTKQYIKLTP